MVKEESRSLERHNRYGDVERGELIIDLELESIDAFDYEYDVDDLGDGRIAVQFWANK